MTRSRNFLDLGPPLTARARPATSTSYYRVPYGALYVGLQSYAKRVRLYGRL